MAGPSLPLICVSHLSTQFLLRDESSPPPSLSCILPVIPGRLCSVGSQALDSGGCHSIGVCQILVVDEGLSLRGPFSPLGQFCFLTFSLPSLCPLTAELRTARMRGKPVKLTVKGHKEGR
jgi:hypothetical protein